MPSTATVTDTRTGAVRSVDISLNSGVAAPDWYGVVGAPGSAISSSLYDFQSFVAGHVSVVADPKGGEQSVISFAIDSSDQPYPGSVPRGDIYSSYRLTPGMDKWISIPMYTPPVGLPSDITSGKFLLISQLAIPGGDNQPNLTFSITSDPLLGGSADGNRHWSMFLRSPLNGQIWLGPVIDDNWHTLVVHVVCESTGGASDGSVELWYDGVKQTLYGGAQILTGIRILELANDAVSYNARLGIDSYRSNGLIAGTYTLYHGAPKIGPSWASVQ